MSSADITLPPGYRLAFHETLDSTNTEALRRANAGEAPGLWIWALSQDKGKGRLGRTWESLHGNLFASLLLRPDCSPGTAAQLGFVAGIALHDAVARLGGGGEGKNLQLKWPNDLLCEGRKAGGILLESSAGQDGGIAVVVGIGLNLAAYPQDTEFPATALAQHGIVATAEKALECLARACDEWLDVWHDGKGFAQIRLAWMECSLPAGAPLQVRLADERLEGTFGGIDGEGALILIQSGKPEKRITTGDVFPL